MNDSSQHTKILIVGAGMAGLTAAAELHESGREVLVIDKGRGVGGRMANRRIGNATFDHGAQFMSARDDRFAARVDEWLDRGVAEEWFRGSENGPIAWMADNQMKGVSEMPAVTIHATHAFSLEHWNDDRQEAGRQLLDAAGPLLGADVSAFQVHGWRYSRPSRIHEEECFILQESPLLVLAGDAFGGGRLEGAALSAWAAADVVG